MVGALHASSSLDTPRAFSEDARRVGEERLWELAYAGDAGARDLLVEHHMALAHKLARRYARSSEPIEDLQQVACLGLVRAVDRFDPSHGTSFTTFAVPTILGELRRHFRDRTWSVRVPRALRDAATAVEHTEEALAKTLGRSPSANEVADELGMSVERVLAAREAALAYRCDSLDRPLRADDVEGSATLGDRVGECDEGLRHAEDDVLIEQLATETLSRRDREVLRLRFHDDLLQREIAERVGVSQMQVSRILREAVQIWQAVALRDPSVRPTGPGPQLAIACRGSSLGSDPGEPHPRCPDVVRHPVTRAKGTYRSSDRCGPGKVRSPPRERKQHPAARPLLVPRRPQRQRVLGPPRG